ncbi:MAG TPA: ABC transporter ATP-binding protein [Rhodocyclaceae bacterium]|nr:ABC transporter ATP-binding protein [Rhodocyclaceae bacterium]
MSAIALEHVSKKWGAQFAVHELSFAAPAGSFVVLLGPSGCGKSTTLRMIAGLDSPSSGRIRIGAEDITDLPPASRRLSMVFQSYALFPHLDVRENILFGIKVRKEPEADRPRRLARVAELLGLSGLLDRKPSQLSGGQQQRVALARAIIAEKPVCLMDEPLSNLDAQLRQEMRREIRGLQQSLGITMIYVTHDQTEAMSMADQVILLRDGSVEQDAAPGTLYAEPASIFVARFIGTPPMNILDLAPGGNGLVIAGSQRLVYRGRLPQDIKLGVRPEHIRIDPDSGIRATVRSVEYFGADTVITSSLGTNSIAARVPGKHVVAAGTQLPLTWDTSAQHYFDAISGKRTDEVACRILQRSPTTTEETRA